MGLYTDFISRVSCMDKTEPQVAMDRTAYNELNRRLAVMDPDTPTAFAAANEVQTVGAFTGSANGISSGNYTLTVTPPAALGSAVTTANIAYNANAATVEGAINTACTGNIVGWVNGDISVSGGGLDSAAVVLTHDGTSTTQTNWSPTVIADVDLDGGVNANAVLTTVNGTLTLTAPAVGTAYNGEVFYLSSNGALSVTYNSSNTTFVLEYNAGTTNHTQMKGEIDTNVAANPAWPQFACAITGDANALEAGDDTVNATTALGEDLGGLGSVTTNTAGQPQRYAWAVLNAMSLIASPPVYGESLAADATLATNPGTNPNWPSQSLLRVLAWQASIDDVNPTIRTQLENLFHIDNRR